MSASTNDPFVLPKRKNTQPVVTLEAYNLQKLDNYPSLKPHVIKEIKKYHATRQVERAKLLKEFDDASQEAVKGVIHQSDIAMTDVIHAFKQTSSTGVFSRWYTYDRPSTMSSSQYKSIAYVMEAWCSAPGNELKGAVVRSLHNMFLEAQWAPTVDLTENGSSVTLMINCRFPKAEVDTTVATTSNKRDDNEDVTCPICFERPCNIALECAHSFCTTCINALLAKYPLGTHVCPTCRTAISPDFMDAVNCKK